MSDPTASPRLCPHPHGVNAFLLVFAIACALRWTRTPWWGSGYAIDFAWGGIYLDLRARGLPLLSHARLAIERARTAAAVFGGLCLIELSQLWLPSWHHDPLDYLAYAAGVAVAVLVDALSAKPDTA